MTPEKLVETVKDHFEYHKNDEEVIVTSDGTCFHVKDAQDAFNHKRTNLLDAWIVTRDGKGREFTNMKDAKAPTMDESDEIRKEKGDAAFAAQEEELKKQADAKAKEEAAAKAKIEEEEAAKAKAEAEAKAKAEKKGK